MSTPPPAPSVQRHYTSRAQCGQQIVRSFDAKILCEISTQTLQLVRRFACSRVNEKENVCARAQRAIVSAEISCFVFRNYGPEFALNLLNFLEIETNQRRE